MVLVLVLPASVHLLLLLPVLLVAVARLAKCAMLCEVV